MCRSPYSGETNVVLHNLRIRNPVPKGVDCVDEKLPPGKLRCDFCWQLKDRKEIGIGRHSYTEEKLWTSVTLYICADCELMPPSKDVIHAVATKKAQDEKLEANP